MADTDTDKLAAILQAEAEACRQSSNLNGEYNTAFWVAAIVLDSLATRLSALPPPPQETGE